MVAQLVERGRFRHQRSAVRIPTLANFIYQLYIEIEKTKIKKKRPGMAHLKKSLVKRLWVQLPPGVSGLALNHP